MVFFLCIFKRNVEIKILRINALKKWRGKKKKTSPHYDNKVAPVEAVKMGYRPNIYQQKMLEEKADFFPGIVILEQTTAKFLRLVHPLSMWEVQNVMTFSRNKCRWHFVAA